MFPKDETNLSAYAVDFFSLAPTNWRGARVLIIPFIKPYLYWPNSLQVIFYLCFRWPTIHWYMLP